MIQTSFSDLEKKTGEVGFVEEILYSIVRVSGLPQAKPHEIVVFEEGEFGQVLSINPKYVEVLLLEDHPVKIGHKVARTNSPLVIKGSDKFLGQTIDPLTRNFFTKKFLEVDGKDYNIQAAPPAIMDRGVIDKPLRSGAIMVDLAIPLGKGQRELVIGDRKTGKTDFLFQIIETQAKEGTICIYGAIGKKREDILKIQEFATKKGIADKLIIIAATSSDPTGLIYLAPFSAMTIAEYFRDQGKDTLVVLDDLTTHAKFYREMALLIKMFPGRSSYPGDIFYTHARLLERAGKFKLKTGKEVHVSCIPTAESVLGDLSGYIQTNLMAMTDGHIYFDIELFNQGRRPAINPFLSVTRVGQQAQTKLKRELSRHLTSFLNHHNKLTRYIHFGAELSEEVRGTLAKGDLIYEFFSQPPSTICPVNMSVFLFGTIVNDMWKGVMVVNAKKSWNKLVIKYQTDANYRKQIDDLVNSVDKFADLLAILKKSGWDLIKV